MKISEVLLGITAEREARETVKRYKKNAPIGRDQRRENEWAEGLARRLNRRQIAIYGPTAIAFAAAGGLIGKKLLEQPSYHGPIEEMGGLPELDEQTFTAMVESLNQTKVPYLQKIARDVQVLHTQRQVPQELQWLLDKDSIPVPIVVDKNTEISTTFVNFDEYPSSGPFLLTQDVDNTQTTFYGAAPSFAGIKLGTRFFRDLEIGDAMFLAKESETIRGYFICFNEAFSWATKHVGIITNEDGSKIDDPIDQLRAGMSLVGRRIEEHRNQNLVLDGLPIFLLATAVQDGIASRTIPSQALSRVNIDVAAKYIDQDQAVKSRVLEIRDIWTAAGERFLPTHSPRMLMDHIFVDNPLTNAILGYWREIGEPVENRSLME